MLVSKFEGIAHFGLQCPYIYKFFPNIPCVFLKFPSFFLEISQHLPPTSLFLTCFMFLLWPTLLLVFYALPYYFSTVLQATSASVYCIASMYVKWSGTWNVLLFLVAWQEFLLLFAFFVFLVDNCKNISYILLQRGRNERLLRFELFFYLFFLYRWNIMVCYFLLYMVAALQNDR